MKKKNNGFSFEPVHHLTEDEINSPEFNPEEFAPAPEASAKDPGTKVSNIRSSLFFALLCGVAALIIALVGTLTSYAAGKSTDIVRRELVLELFNNCSSATFYKEVDGCDVYVAYYKSRLAGYAVFTSQDGFSGDIGILVGVDSENNTCGVKIVSQSESAGLGDKITENSFLSQFKGLSDEIARDDVELVSCATVSSEAVRIGVNRAITLGLNISDIADDLGVETISGEEIEEEVRKEEEEKNNNSSSDTDKQTVDTGEADSTEFSGAGGTNTNKGDKDKPVKETDVTTVYETETKKSDTTAETKAPETAKPTTDAPVTTAPTTTAPETKPPVTTAPETTEEPDTTAVPDTTAAPDTTADAANIES